MTTIHDRILLPHGSAAAAWEDRYQAARQTLRHVNKQADATNDDRAFDRLNLKAQRIAEACGRIQARIIDALRAER